VPGGPPHRNSGGDATSAGAAAPTAAVGRRRGAQGLAPEERLRRRQDYLRAYRTGRRRGGRYATLFHLPNDLGAARLGITASRKVGKSVVRQRLKRRVREIYRRWERRSDLPSLDLIVNLKPTAAEASFAELRRELLRQLASLLPGAEPPPPRRRDTRPPGPGRGSGGTPPDGSGR
jgi:ribonuclease P protein component